MCLGHQAGTQLQPKSYGSSGQDLPRYRNTQSFSRFGGRGSIRKDLEESRWKSSLMRLSGHCRLMSAPITMGLFRDERSSFYNIHLVTRSLGETYYPDDATVSSCLSRETEVGGRSENVYNEAEAAGLNFQGNQG